MKNSNYYSFLILLSIVLFCSHTYAQDSSLFMHYSIFGGAAFPLGDFSSTTANDAGFAHTGLCAMVEADKNISEDVYWASSIALAVNPMDQSSLENYTGVQGGNFLKYNGSNVSTGSYLTAWLMTGVGFELPVSSAVKIYSVEQIGLLISKIPPITGYYVGSSVTETATTGAAFAVGLGAGVIMHDINLSLRYYTGEPFYTSTETTVYGSWNIRADMPVTLLQFMIGYNF
ncbi:MAG: hypothetical protein WAV76_04205 [Bacteroidota bacterium]